MCPHPTPPAQSHNDPDGVPQSSATASDDLGDGPLLRLDEVSRLVTLDAKTIMRLVQSENFPEPVRLSERRFAWRRRDLRRWLSNPYGWVNF